MELHCLRHGLTVENTRGIYQGTSNATLTTEQLEILASIQFDTSGYDAIYCSPLDRCKDTATALGISDWVVEPRIIERNFGIFEGLSGTECKDRFPHEFAAFQKNDGQYQIPKGESRAEHLSRVRNWLQDIGKHQRVLAITHGGTIDFLYRQSLGAELHGGSEIFSASNASVSSFNAQWPKLTLASYDIPLA